MIKLNFENPFFQFMNTLVEFIVLNILFLLCSLPIFTIGASITALYSTTMKYAKNEQGYVVRSFFNAFRKNFKQSTLIWIFLMILGSVLVFNISFWYTLGSILGTILFILIGVLLLCVYLTSLYVFPILVRFSNTTFQTLKNALLISLQNFRYTLVLLLINGLSLLFLYLFQPFTVFFFVFGLSFIVYIQSFIFIKVLKKYE